MIKTYCDRCGKVITPIPPLIDRQTARLEGEIQISITRIPKYIGYCPEQIDLCVDCRSKIKQMITDFLADDNTECKKDAGRMEKSDIDKAFAAAHECCGGCID